MGDGRDASGGRERILQAVREYTRATHGDFHPEEGLARPFTPGVTPIPYAGRVFGEEEVAAASGGVLDFWLTLGKEGEEFERELAAFVGVRSSLLVNSGSSANLLAVAALTSHLIPADRRLNPGDEIITTAAGFPTTVAPIVQCGAKAVLIDSDPVTGNPLPEALEEAMTGGRTKAAILAHTLGNPFDLSRIAEICARRGVWLIEDNCDALGSLYRLPGKAPALTGSFGDLSTHSFYPPHHITMGEGGAVNAVRDVKLRRILESLRDWGRDCWCPSGRDDTCCKRYGWKLGELPEGYDHKYIYGHLGYNLKPLDLQAAIGRVQLGRLPGFVAARRRNWERLRSGLDDLAEYFEFTMPTHATGRRGGEFLFPEGGPATEPSWFGFYFLVRPSAPFTRGELAAALDGAKIGSRMLFGGNLARQPALLHLRDRDPDGFRVMGSLAGADRIMNDALFIGVYPGLTPAMLDYVVDFFHDFCRAPEKFRK